MLTIYSIKNNTMYVLFAMSDTVEYHVKKFLPIQRCLNLRKTDAII